MRSKSLISKLAAATCAAGLIAGIAGTGSYASTSKASTPKTFSVKVGVGLPGAVAEADLFVAQTLGYFTKFHVHVNLEVLGSTLATQVAAGQVQLGLLGASGLLAPTALGRTETLVYQELPQNQSMGIVSLANSPYNSIESLAGKTVAVTGVGGGPYGEAQIWSDYLATKGLPPLNRMVNSSSSVFSAELANGTVQGVQGQLDLFASQIASGQARVAVSPNTALAHQLLPSTVVGSVIFGLPSLEKANRQGVTDFVAAMRAADAWLKTATSKQIVTQLRHDPLFANISPVTIAQEVPYDRPNLDPTAGYVSKSSWAKTLVTLAKFGTPGVTIPGNSLLSYSHMVDMSFYAASTKLLKAAGFTKALQDHGTAVGN